MIPIEKVEEPFFSCAWGKNAPHCRKGRHGAEGRAASAGAPAGKGGREGGEDGARGRG